MDIDVVYTWVDGNDPELVESMELHVKDFSQRRNVLASQYRDLKELLYSIRSVRRFMPWCRNIFIVTNGQIPDYIDLVSFGAQIVFHADIFPNNSDLPVFNSLAIECNLHRISDLSNYFVYMNNDLFISKLLSVEDLIDIHENEVFLLEHRGMKSVADQAANDPYGMLLAYNNDLLTERFGANTRLSTAHTPQIYIRDECYEVEKLFRDEVIFTSRQKERTSRCAYLRILYTYFRIYRRFGNKPIHQIIGEAGGSVRVADNKDFRHIVIGDSKCDMLSELRKVQIERPLYFCIQDHIWGDHEEAQLKLTAALNEIYP